MIVDSTALPEQAVRDVLASAFQSAGQRCSALRCLYVQEDVAEGITEMLLCAMDELCLGTPWDTATDIGPLIDAAAAQAVQTHVERARVEGRLLKQIAAPGTGHFVGPAVVRVGGIGEIGREVFGPVLHLATFRAEDLDRVVADINATGYGLTFGLHSRIDARVQAVTAAVRAGNLYVNRNQIGAVVGSQPFGGEGLSGTGPKAGGPHYLPRLTRRAEGGSPEPVPTLCDLPGPTGESNRLSLHPRPPILCLGPGAATEAQAAAVRALGGTAEIHPGPLAPEALSARGPLGGVLWWGDAATARALAVALAGREGSIVPLIAGVPDAADVLLERHLCIDTTAAGGNASLLAAAESA
jgi:RHH-type proline utilization regulon transcriptional repressor/proline dehydrogenase/delta 1-pyrroline-5-carboxylate dehydrogenase